MKWKSLLISVAVPLLVGALSALASGGAMSGFAMLNKPSFSPPAWLFPVVWTILYILMGVASYLVIDSDASEEKTKKAITVYAVQLVFNFFWSIIFFNLEQYLFAFFWLLALLFLVVYTTVLFYDISKKAGYLMIPYIIWLIFAGILNFAIFILN